MCEVRLQSRCEIAPHKLDINLNPASADPGQANPGWQAIERQLRIASIASDGLPGRHTEHIPHILLLEDVLRAQIPSLGGAVVKIVCNGERPWKPNQAMRSRNWKMHIQVKNRAVQPTKRWWRSNTLVPRSMNEKTSHRAIS